MKNSFGSPKFIEEQIYDEGEKLIGTIRIKPSGVLWKPKSQHKFYTVTLEQFATWITSEQTNAKRTES